MIKVGKKSSTGYYRLQENLVQVSTGSSTELLKALRLLKMIIGDEKFTRSYFKGPNIVKEDYGWRMKLVQVTTGYYSLPKNKLLDTIIFAKISTGYYR